MGEVYRARDTRLDRNVAIKILPHAFVADPERVARFEREAKVLASLNHPHIAALYGRGRGRWFKALVMELVEGEDLAQRLTRRPIPLAEALPIANKSPKPSKRPTSRGSSIAISNRRISSCDIACGFIDTSYNGESFFVGHAYFTGADEPYEKLKSSTRRRPFAAPDQGRIAVKVINHYGDEMLKVFDV